MFMIHETLPNKRKLKNIMEFPSIKSPSLWYGSGLKKKDIIMHSLLNKCKKTHFLYEISSEKI
jgi:hypothetical protein